MACVKKELLLEKSCCLLNLIFPVQFDYSKNDINIKYIPVHDLRVLMMNITVFWGMMPCSFVISFHCFRGACSRHFQVVQVACQMTNQLKTETLILCKGTCCGLFSHTWAFDASLDLLYENLKTITGTFA